MGLLSQGRPLNWDETKQYTGHVQQRGIAQFINIYHKSKDRVDYPFKWGDEVEYILVKFDHQNKQVRVSITAEQVFQRIEAQKKREPSQAGKSCWNPEYAAYMVEGTPGSPYGADGNLLAGLCAVEENMRFRRNEVLSVLEEDESVMSITNFPRLGCPDFTWPPSQAQPATSVSGSLFFPDEAIFGGHPRFKTLSKNIRDRRGRRVIINVPIFRDLKTPNPFLELYNEREFLEARRENQVYMDATGFGMGCCCLQITFQATNIEEAKTLYDQLAPVTPIALALSAASPVYRGYLTDRDCRWEVVSSSVDDRTREESGESAPTGGPKAPLIAKSRYASISTYLSRQGQKFNDIPLVYNRSYYELMLANKVDPCLAKHMAHLFIREPVAVYREKLEQTDQELDHFENIQSTNWQTMRFKPPPQVDSRIGWRVEFRPLEAQVSDFENAAYVVFVTLLSRVILAYKLNLLIPLSLVDENMIEAQKRDAAKMSEFWFRRDIMRRSCEAAAPAPSSQSVLEDSSNSPPSCSWSSGAGSPDPNGSPLGASNPQAPAGAQAHRRLGLKGLTNHHHQNHHHHQHPHHHHHHHHHHRKSAKSASLAPTNNNHMNSSSSASGSSTNSNSSSTNNNNNNTNAINHNNHQQLEAAGKQDLRAYATRMNLNEIINGSESFIGLMPIIHHYVDTLNDGLCAEEILRIKQYLRLISDRASAKTKTTAAVLRDFIGAHPSYRQDSVVDERVAYDLLKLLDRVGRDELLCAELTGDHKPAPAQLLQADPAAASLVCCNPQHRQLIQLGQSSRLAHQHQHQQRQHYAKKLSPSS